VSNADICVIYIQSIIYSDINKRAALFPAKMMKIGFEKLFFQSFFLMK